MSNTPELRTERILLRRPTANDDENLYQLHSSPAVMKYINGGIPHSRAEVSQYHKQLLENLSSGDPKYNFWIAETIDDRQFIGWFILKYMDNTEEIEIGYRLMEESWGKGYATEGSVIILDYGLNTIKLPRIMGIARPDNLASRRVLEKIGLIYEGMGHYYNTDVVCYAIHSKDQG